MAKLKEDEEEIWHSYIIHQSILTPYSNYFIKLTMTVDVVFMEFSSIVLSIT
jgi:hypothetical protein